MEILSWLIPVSCLALYVIWASYVLRKQKVKEDKQRKDIEDYFECKKQEEIARYNLEKEALAKENYFYNVGAIEGLIRGVETDRYGLPIFKKPTDNK